MTTGGAARCTGGAQLESHGTRGVWAGREHSGSGPTCSATGLFAVEKDNVKFFSGQFKCNRAADNSAADDSNVEYFHMAILAGIFWEA